MYRLFKLAIRLAIILVIIFIATQPFNWFCKLTNKCEPFYFSYYIPKREGTQPLLINLEVTNYRADLLFEPVESSLTTVSNRKNIVFYRAKNLTNHPIRFRPSFITEPQYATTFIKRYDCLCSQEYKLKADEEIQLKMRFEVSEKNYFEPRFGNHGGASLKLRYLVK